MHLAIVTCLPPVSGGVADYGRQMTQAISKLGTFERISVVCQEGAAPFPSEPGEGRLTLEPAWKRDSIRTAYRINHCLRRLRPDLVWCNVGGSMFGRSIVPAVAGFRFLRSSYYRDIPSVATIHEVTSLVRLNEVVPSSPTRMVVNIMSPRIMRSLCRSSVVCVLLRDHIGRITREYPQTRLAHIPHGTYVSPEVLPGCSKPTLLFFGTIAPYKGIELLVGTFRTLRNKFAGLTLTIAGDIHPRFGQYYERLSHEFRNEIGVDWRGFVGDHDLRQLFSHATAVVLPYLATTGTSGVLFRAAAWGRPVIASNAEELRIACAESGIKAWFFESGNQDSLTKTISRVLEDPRLSEADCRENVNVMKRMTIDLTARAYLNAFSSALAVTRS